jgi:3-keto-L-gulonate-6-phosphate decarboxylase
MNCASHMISILLVTVLLCSSGCGAASAVKALGSLGVAASAAKTAAVSTTSARMVPASGAAVSRLGAASAVVKSAGKAEKPHKPDLGIMADVVQYMVPNTPSSDHKKR